MILVLIRRYHTAEMTTQQVDERTVLSRHGIRPTEQRVAVLAALADEPNDATAQQVHAKLAAAGVPIGLATVYRALALLAEHGVVDELMHRPGETCYRLCGEEHHHHLVCSQCHRVVELADCELDQWLERVSARHGFVPTSHRLEATGLCSDCQPPA
jgi:Fur family transcriptional regulator, ferric uptake regulator